MATANLPTAFFGDNFGVKNSDLEKFSTPLWRKSGLCRSLFRVSAKRGRQSGRRDGQKLLPVDRQWRRRARARRCEDRLRLHRRYYHKKFGAGGAHGTLHRAKPPFPMPVPVGQQRGEAHNLYPVKTPVNDVDLEKKSSCSTKSINLRTASIHG